MGMFDRVWFRCPECDGSVEVQSKAGKCHLTDYPQSEVPTDIASDIFNEVVYCEKCDTPYTVEFDQEPQGFHRMRLVK